MNYAQYHVDTKWKLFLLIKTTATVLIGYVRKSEIRTEVCTHKPKKFTMWDILTAFTDEG